MNRNKQKIKVFKYDFSILRKNKLKKIKLVDTTNKKAKWSFTGGPFGSNLQSSDYTESGIRVIQLQNIGVGFFNDNYKIFTSEEKANELLSCNIYPNEIIISKMGDPVGRACIVPNFEKRYIMCSDGIRIVVDETKYSKTYIYYAINSPSFRLKIFRNSTGSTRRRIGLDVLKNLEMLILKEKKDQEQIAGCLKTLDDLILLEERKLEQLKIYKKGILQRLYPPKDKNTPELRFPKFNQKWKKNKLKEICIFKNGGSYENNISKSGKYDLITLNSIDIEGNLKDKHHTVDYGEWYLCKNDIVMILSDVATGKFLGLSAIIPKNDKYVLNQRVGLLRVHKDKSANFIRYFINQNQKYFMSHGQGANQKNLSKEDVLSFCLMLLIDIKEQQKIAECISSIDDLISAQTEKIKALQQHKKGLLQGLFPSIEEVKNE